MRQLFQMHVGREYLNFRRIRKFSIFQPSFLQDNLDSSLVNFEEDSVVILV